MFRDQRVMCKKICYEMKQQTQGNSQKQQQILQSITHEN